MSPDDSATSNSNHSIHLHSFTNPDPTQWYNFFGSEYNIEFPKQDISIIKQWIAQKKSPNFHTFLTHLLEDFKFKITEMHVKLERSDEPNQEFIIEPIKLVKFADPTESEKPSPVEDDVRIGKGKEINTKTIQNMEKDKAEYFFDQFNKDLDKVLPGVNVKDQHSDDFEKNIPEKSIERSSASSKITLNPNDDEFMF